MFSWDKTRSVGSSAFKIDIDTVLQLLINVMTPGTANNPFVINMSLGAGAYVSQCTSQSPTIAPLVQTLFDIGVPITEDNQGTSFAAPHVAGFSRVPALRLSPGCALLRGCPGP